MSEKNNSSFLHSVPNGTAVTNNDIQPSFVGARTSGNLSRGISHPSMTSSKFMNSRLMPSNSFKSELNNILKKNIQQFVSIQK